MRWWHRLLTYVRRCPDCPHSQSAHNGAGICEVPRCLCRLG